MRLWLASLVWTFSIACVGTVGSGDPTNSEGAPEANGDGISVDDAPVDANSPGAEDPSDDEPAGDETPNDANSRPIGITGEELPIPPTRGFSTVPAPGVHPRILLSPSDLPERREIALSPGTIAHAATEVLRTHAAQTIDDPSSDLGAAFQQALAGQLAAPSDQLLGTGKVVLYGSGTHGLYGTLAGAAWVALMDDNEERGQILSEALAQVAEAHNEVYLPESSNRFAHDVNVDLALAYDFLHRYMTDDQRESVRALIARMVQGRVAYGVGMNAAEVSTNWRTHHDHIVIAALAIEGEEGYDSNVYESNAEKLRLFHSFYGVNSSGMPHEGLGYFAFGMNWGALTTLATARRGQDLFSSSNLYKSFHYALHETAPWGEGMTFGHSDGTNWATGSGASSLYTVFKYVWPDDALVDYIYRQNRIGGRQDRIPLIEAMFGLEPLPTSASPAELAKSFGLPLTLYSPLKGYTYARSDWGPDAVRLDFDARSDLWELGHIHADRNSFTLYALGRAWAEDPGYHMGWSDQHSGVLIDGVGQAGNSIDTLRPPMPAKMVDVRDTSSLFVATGDSTASYNWTRSTELPLEASGFTWRDFLADEAFEGEMHDEQILARRHGSAERVIRSVALVRGAHPFVLIADDIQKDSDPNLYSWFFNTRGSYPRDELTIEFEGTPSSTQAVLRHDFDRANGTPRLLVRVLEAAGEERPIRISDDKIRGYSDVHTHRRVFVERSDTVAPGFRIALIPFYAGDPLPAVDYDGTTVTVTQGGVSASATLSTVNGQTFIEP